MKNNTILRFCQFITEDVINDTPESYINQVLSKLKHKIDNFFDYEKEQGDIIKMDKSDNMDKVSLKEIGVWLESSEVSKFSQSYENLTVKFSDDENTYTLIIIIDIKEALPKNGTEFNVDDIKKCYIKFKKYNLDTYEVIGQITKNTEIDSIDEEFLINLKIELDDEYDNSEEFKIETE